MSDLFASNSLYCQPAMTSVRSSFVGHAAKEQYERTYTSKRPCIGSPLQ